MDPIEHTFERPSWNCRTCHDPWPCKSAREQMLAEMRPTEIGIACWTYLELALEELQDLDPAALFDRFLYWSRPRRLSSR